jgi:signal transduction histidine kinase
MTLPRRFAELARGVRLPRRTVRLRLTLLYGSLFLVSGAVLLVITYLLVRHSTPHAVFFGSLPVTNIQGHAPHGLPNFPPSHPPIPRNAPSLKQQISSQAVRQHAAELHQLLTQSGVALAIMTVVSIALGWLVAGRVLGPLQTMTASTRRISEDNLHQRLALQGPRDELKDLADTIDGLLGRLEAAFDAQRRFIANASHELRTPLAMMRTSLDVANGKPGRVPLQVIALGDKVREGLDQADRLLEGFLTLARAQHSAAADQTTVSLHETVSTAIQARRAAIDEMGIEVQQAIREVQVHGSETLLSRMVENVIDNAIKHNEPWGWIRIETHTHGDVARLVVESGGARLEESEVLELAQPFRRIGAERTSSENGVGLGLSIVAAIAVAHGGKLELNARPQGGLRVLIELPHVDDRVLGAGDRA